MKPKNKTVRQRNTNTCRLSDVELSAYIIVPCFARNHYSKTLISSISITYKISCQKELTYLKLTYRLSGNGYKVAMLSYLNLIVT